METKEDLIKEAVQQLLRIAKLYSRIEELPVPVADGVAVTTREAHTIQAIGDHDNMSVTQVAQYFAITKSAASQMVSKLIDRGYLNKKQSPHSNKEYHLFLTQLGWKAFHAHEQFHGADLATLIDSLSGFSLNQIATLSVLLESIGSVMNQRLIRERGK